MGNLFLITDYGAQSDTQEAQTAAIQRAIDDADASQGTVVIPKGIFKTGTLNLKSASLCLEKGGVLLASEKREDYRRIGYLHCEFGETICLLYSLGGQDISIYGEGTIDLNGKSFFDFQTYQLPPKIADRFDEEAKQETTASFDWRPNQSIFFHLCKHVTLRDVTILDAPCWTLTFSECQRVLVDGITNIGHPRIPNNDGIHLSACRDVIIANCNISSADDCIAVSSITNWLKPCENISVVNCILRSFSKAIVLGYSHSIVRNVTISNCNILESNRGFCIMPATQTGMVENVVVSNLRIDTRIRAGNWWGNGEPVFIYSLPYQTLDHRDYRQELALRKYSVNVRNILFQNLICTAENAAGVVGMDNMENVKFDGFFVQLKEGKHLALKGNVFDTAPSTVCVPVPGDSSNPCVFCVQGVKVELSDVSGCGIHGEPGSILQCPDIP